ncbi:hypothetical protein [Nocardia sp. NPDC019255]|uniref:hypothetical protein n=1 Tax=Nocardia sp. NPDC019255 TaxID=3154591 RepID=UPI0033C15B99
MRALEVFTDREHEWSTVVDSVRNVHARVTGPGFDVEDLESPRRNVLTFYGVGGIGKTTLSRQVYDHLSDRNDDPAQCPWPTPVLPKTTAVWLDLSRQAGLDFESLILTVRLSVAKFGPMPVFDLAFRRYWEHSHPNESIEEHLRSRRFFGRFSPAASRQMDSVLADVAQVLGLPGTVGALVGKGLASVVRALRDKRRHVQALACRRLPDLLEAEPNIEALSFYPHLLAWDLAHVPRKRSELLVILLDTFEDVGDRTNRERERLIQRLVWLLPNALFIITGRDRLQWDDQRLEGQLDWVGTQRWPQLGAGATDEPRQHLVGYLSATDCDAYLAQRLTRSGEPLIPAETRAMIAARSSGLPLYLDLAVMRFLTLHAAEARVPCVDEFDTDFTALVTRIFRDLTPEERHVARAVSLLDAFSVDLATATAGLDRDSATLRLVERPFIEHHPTALWPYRLHNLVRSAIRDGDTTEDAWSPGDWRRAAERAHTALGAHWRDTARTDPGQITAYLAHGLRLAHEYALPVSWLIDAAVVYADNSVGEPLHFPAATDSPATILARTLTAVGQRNRQDRRTTVADLRALIDSGQLPDEMVELPQYYLALCERDLGNITESMNGMRAVRDRGGRLAAAASRGLLHLARRLGHFREALTLAEGLGTAGRRHRAIGEIWCWHANIGTACAALARARDDALTHGLPAEAALCQTYLAFASAFQDRSRAAEQIARAHDMLDESPQLWAGAQLAVAELIRDAGLDPALPTRAANVADAALADGLTSPAAYARFAACFHAAILEDPTLVDAALEGLRASVNGDEFAYLMEIAHIMTVTPAPTELPGADWIDGEPTVNTLWTQLVTDRRRELAATERN